MKLNTKSLFLFVLLAIAVFFFLEYRVFLLEFAERELQKNWILGGAILYVLYVGLCAIGIPVAPLTVMSGALIGFGKTMVIMVPSLVSATVILFVLGRTIFKERVAKKRAEKKSLEILLKVLETSPFKWLFYLRISGITPFGLTTYLVSMTRVPIRKLLIPSLLGTLPHLTLQTYLGVAGREIVDSGVNQQTLKIVLLSMGIGILALFGAQIKRAYRKEAEKIASAESAA